MSIREGARLQSFPDDYLFYGKDGMKRLEIGNAVPPLLSCAIAKEVLNAMNNDLNGEEVPKQYRQISLFDIEQN